MTVLAGSTVVLAGGAGFIGSHIADQLVLQDVGEIRIIDDLSRGSLENLAGVLPDPRVRFVEADLRDPAVLVQALRGADYWIHLPAPRIPACAENPRAAFDVMVAGFFELLECAKNSTLKKLLFPSSVAVYGTASQFPTPESEPPYSNRSFYGAAKFFGEQLLRSYHQMYGLPYIVLRNVNSYGPRMQTGPAAEVMIRWIDALEQGQRPVIHGDGSSTVDFVHVADVARANILALASPVEDEIINIAAGEEVSLNALLAMLQRITGKHIAAEYRGGNAVNPVNRRLVDIAKAKQLLGYEPSIRLEDGLRSLYAWRVARGTMALA